MKKLLLFLITIIFILTIISKEINILISFLLLYVPLAINYYYSLKDGEEIVIKNKIIYIFYILISVIYYLITKDYLATSILLLILISYHIFNPRIIIEEKYLYANKIFYDKRTSIPKTITNKYKNAGIDIIKDKKNKEEIIVANSNEELEKIYEEIKKNRYKYENLVRTKKLHIITSFILPAIVLFIYIFDLPNPLTITTMLLIFFLYSITNIFLSIYLTSEKDIMDRKPRKKGDIIFSKEEKLFIIVNIFSNIMAITLPYMSITYNSNNNIITIYAFMIAIIFTNLVNIAYHLNDSMTIKNIFLSIINKIYLTIIITSIAILFYSRHIYDYFNLFHFLNYLKILLISFLAIAWEDIIKLARYINIKKGIKHGRDN